MQIAEFHNIYVFTLFRGVESHSNSIQANLLFNSNSAKRNPNSAKSNSNSEVGAHLEN